MTWTRLSDDFADSPAVLGLSDAAFRLHVTALVWSNKQLTDGHVPMRAVYLFAGADPVPIVEELIAAGLWEDAGSHFQLDWSDQESADSVRERQAANAKRQQRHRDRQKRHARGDHSLCERCSAVVGNAKRNGVTDGERVPPLTGSPTRPDPTPREGREGSARESAELAPAPGMSWTAEQGWH